MRDDQLADLAVYARTLAVQTKSAKVRAACLVVIKAARARRSALRRTRREAPQSPFYNPVEPPVTVVRDALPETESANLAPITWTGAPDTETA